MKITDKYLKELIKEALTTGITSEQVSGNQIILSINVGNISSFSMADTIATTYIRKYMEKNYPKRMYLIPRLTPAVKNNYSNWNAIVTLE